MQTFKAVEPTELFAGTLFLTPEQAAPRVTARQLVEDGEGFKILSRVQFKVGEVFGFDGEPPCTVTPVEEETKTETGETHELPKRVRRR
jgi:hypothetical protein